MNEQLKRLIELQKIDSTVLSMSRLIASFPSKILDAEAPLNESRTKFNALKQGLEVLEKKRRDKEHMLEESDEKIRKLKLRTSEIKTNKEYQAILKEIEAVEKERSVTEDDILAAMEEMDVFSKQLHSEEQKVRAEGQKVDGLKRKLDEERTSLEKELSIAKAERAKIASSIDPEVYEEYIKVMEAVGGLAVTEAKEEICQGCNMNIPPQLFVELKKNEDIICCPQCRRILFYRNSAETHATAKE